MDTRFTKSTREVKDMVLTTSDPVQSIDQQVKPTSMISEMNQCTIKPTIRDSLSKNVDIVLPRDTVNLQSVTYEREKEVVREIKSSDFSSKTQLPFGIGKNLKKSSSFSDTTVSFSEARSYQTGEDSNIKRTRSFPERNGFVGSVNNRNCLFEETTSVGLSKVEPRLHILRLHLRLLQLPLHRVPLEI